MPSLSSTHLPTQQNNDPGVTLPPPPHPSRRARPRTHFPPMPSPLITNHGSRHAVRRPVCGSSIHGMGTLRQCTRRSSSAGAAPCRHAAAVGPRTAHSSGAGSKQHAPLAAVKAGRPARTVCCARAERCAGGAHAAMGAVSGGQKGADTTATPVCLGACSMHVQPRSGTI